MPSGSMGERGSVEAIMDVEKAVEAGGRKKLNGVVKVLEYLKAQGSPRVVLQAIQTLRAIFTRLLENRDVGLCLPQLPNDPENPKVRYRAWIGTRYQQFVAELVKLVRSKQKGLQVPSLSTMMHLLGTESRAAEKAGHRSQWNRKSFNALVMAVLNNPNYHDDLRDSLVNHAAPHADVILRLCEAMRQIMQNQQTASSQRRLLVPPMALADSAFSLLWALGPVAKNPGSAHFFYDPQASDSMTDASEEYLATVSRTARRRKRRKLANPASDDPGGLSAGLTLALKQAFSGAWMALLSEGQLSAESMRILLQGIHTQVIPAVHNPLRLADFLSAAYSHGGVIALLALDGVFALMMLHKLEYPDFYVKLYALFDDQLLHSKYRTRFFKLADLFLSSTHVPAYLVAAFVKRTVRLCLHAPGPGVLMALAFAHNMLNRHRPVAVLLHRPSGCSMDPVSEDPYVMEEKDASKCRAIDSSLWELEILFDHYLPDMAQFARVFREDFKQKRLEMDEFSSSTYQSLFERESKRRGKHYPMAYKPATSLFANDAAFKFWDFD